jgi:exportin-1
MVILKLLSEEIFDYSAEQMTQAKTRALKDQMCGEFGEIFELCSEVLGKAQKPSLIKATLETLLRFLNWIPLGYIFETNIIDNLVTRVRSSHPPICAPCGTRLTSSVLNLQFLEVPDFRNVTLKCLSEIGGLQVVPEYNAKFVVLFQMVMTSVNKMIPPSTSACAACCKSVCDAPG